MSKVSDTFRITLGINKVAIEELSEPLKPYLLNHKVKMVGKYFICDEQKTVLVAELSDIKNLKIALSIVDGTENIGLDVFYNRGLEKFYPLLEKVKASLVLKGEWERPSFIIYKKNSPILIVFEALDTVYAIAPYIEDATPEFDTPELDFKNKWWECKKCGGRFLNPTTPKHDRRFVKNGIWTTETCDGEVLMRLSPEAE